MTGEHRPTVDVAIAGQVYEVSGFDNDEEAREFIHNLDSLSSATVEVTGPF